MRIASPTRATAGVVAALAAAAAITYAGPAASQPGTTTSGATAQKTSTHQSGAPRVENADARIQKLHTQLKITPAQEAQWNTVAQIMRENAQQMDDAIAQRKQPQTMTAVDDLKAYEAIAKTHAQALDKLIPAFKSLYDSLSDDQKKTADEIFSKNRSHHS